MNFTPGPWESLGSVVRVNRYGDEDHHIEVCSLPYYLGDERRANAALIAAAPEMYEALKIMTALVRLKYGNLEKDVWDKPDLSDNQQQLIIEQLQQPLS